MFTRKAIKREEWSNKKSNMMVDPFKRENKGPVDGQILKSQHIVILHRKSDRAPTFENVRSPTSTVPTAAASPACL